MRMHFCFQIQIIMDKQNEINKSNKGPLKSWLIDKQQKIVFFVVVNL